MENITQPRARRDLAPDILKLIATVGVVVIHISAQGVTSFALGSFNWLVCTFWDSLARFAVPVFFMCTGAMMLDPGKELTIGHIYKKYFLRVLWILLFWSWAYYIFTIVGQYVLSGWWEPNGLLNSFIQTLRMNHHLHLYYLQMLLLLYVCLPVLRVFVRASSEKEQNYAIGIWLALGIALPLLINYYPLSWFGGLIPSMRIDMVWAALGYALLGRVMYSREPDRRHLAGYVWMFGIGLVVTFGGTVAASMLTGEVELGFLEGMSPGPALCAAGLFGFIRILCLERSSSPLIAKLTRASFCVYLIHHFFIMVFRQIGFDVLLFTPLIEVPVETAAVIALSLVGWKILSVIPFVKDHLI